MIAEIRFLALQPCRVSNLLTHWNLILGEGACKIEFASVSVYCRVGRARTFIGT